MEPKDDIHAAEEGSIGVTLRTKGNTDEQILNRLAANWTARAGHWFNRERAVAAPTAPKVFDNEDPRI